VPSAPVALISQPGLCVWHKHDTSFGLPKVWLGLNGICIWGVGGAQVHWHQPMHLHNSMPVEVDWNSHQERVLVCMVPLSLSAPLSNPCRVSPTPPPPGATPHAPRTPTSAPEAARSEPRGVHHPQTSPQLHTMTPALHTPSHPHPPLSGAPEAVHSDPRRLHHPRSHRQQPPAGACAGRPATANCLPC
jgi:hypothetical protein